MMPVEEMVLEKLRTLPPEQQEKVLHFVEFLAQKQTPKSRQHSIEGIWADLGVNITEKELEEARKEMWGQFPRELSK